MFKYWKAVYLIYGSSFHHSGFDDKKHPSYHMLDNLWDELAEHEENPGLSWSATNDSAIKMSGAYAIRDVVTDIWTFTPKFYKELNND